MASTCAGNVYNEWCAIIFVNFYKDRHTLFCPQGMGSCYVLLPFSSASFR